MASVKKASGLAVMGLAAALALTGCGSSTPSGGDGKSPLIIGTTDRVSTLDPAASYDNGSYTVEIQVFQFLYGFKPGDVTPQPDAAESCEFAEPTVVQCKIKPGLKFANGHDLTASDVKFSYDRQVAIEHPNGPASLLANLVKVELVDDLTVDFHLEAANDQTFLQVVATPVGPIVDEEVFSATGLTTDEEIVSANAFSGPYTITSFKINDLITFAPYADYNGVQGTVANGGITLKTYSEATNLKLAIANGEIDVAYRSLTPTDITDLDKNYPDVTVYKGAGGEIRYMVFNLNTMPGDTPEQKLAVRQAIASVVDRDELAEVVYNDLYTPLCSWVPDGQAGANQAACDTYPLDLTAAAQYLSDAGLTVPVTLDLQYCPDHYGTTSDQ
ncbi:MAG: ABC transporter substrate-binding protein, partial [Propionibacteriaceae bacterium]|nr:ABC transporter substrate-binding protein [Propionibacteriaceae bacterium]